MKENHPDSIQKALLILPPVIRMKVQSAIQGAIDHVHDIVLRAERPVCVYLGDKQMYLTETGCLTDSLTSQKLVTTSNNHIIECFNNSCGYSVYSHINEIKEGFITINGGHRVGISGTAVMSGESIHNVRDISTISIRISRQIKGCADVITSDYIKSQGGLLICGSPCSGKTTLIRDMSRLLSAVYSNRVSVVDTRGEIASVYNGVCQNDVGLCDVLDLYPRAEGIMQAVRSLSPQHIICDEIGSPTDVRAILHGVNSGVRFVATLHAHNKEELLSRKIVKNILSTGAFEKIVFLQGRENPCVLNNSFSIGEFDCV